MRKLTITRRHLKLSSYSVLVLGLLIPPVVTSAETILAEPRCCTGNTISMNDTSYCLGRDGRLYPADSAPASCSSDAHTKSGRCRIPPETITMDSAGRPPAGYTLIRAEVLCSEQPLDSIVSVMWKMKSPPTPTAVRIVPTARLIKREPLHCGSEGNDKRMTVELVISTSVVEKVKLAQKTGTLALVTESSSDPTGYCK